MVLVQTNAEVDHSVHSMHNEVRSRAALKTSTAPLILPTLLSCVFNYI